MKKFLLILLAVTLAISIPVGVVFANSATQQIDFDLDEGTYEAWDLGPDGDYINVPTSAVFEGKIRFTEDYCYLSAMSGTITIDGVVYQILVRTHKPSETIFYGELELGTPGEIGYYYEEQIYCYVEANIKGSKYIGTLIGLHTIEIDTTGQLVEYGLSSLHFEGIMDGTWVISSLSGDWPEIR